VNMFRFEKLVFLLNIKQENKVDCKEDLIMAIVTNFAAENYRLDDSNVDAMFAQANEVAVADFAPAANEATSSTTTLFVSNDDNKVIVAFVG